MRIDWTAAETLFAGTAQRGASDDEASGWRAVNSWLLEIEVLHFILVACWRLHIQYGASSLKARTTACEVVAPNRDATALIA